MSVSWDLDPIRDQIRELNRERMEVASRRATQELKRTAPVGETAELQRSTGVEVVSVTSRTIIAEARVDVDYGSFVVEGTPGHEIRPRRAKSLAFYWPKRGATVFFAKVNHPGTSPNPFYDRVIERWPEILKSAL